MIKPLTQDDKDFVCSMPGMTEELARWIFAANDHIKNLEGLRWILNSLVEQDMLARPEELLKILNGEIKL